jgi:hypothetical protein
MMTQRDNILQELKELQSSLANITIQNIYQVPAGYFEGLADQVLRRSKALEAESAIGELECLSSLLNSISKKTPFTVPAKYFDGADERTTSVINSDNKHQTAAEELETLSPLLSGLEKEMPYSVPEGYFQEINKAITIEAVKPAVKVISITKQTWFRYAAAAVVTGFVVLSGFLIFNKPKAIDPNEKSFAWVEKNLKKVSTDAIDDFVALAETDEAAPVIANVDPKIKSEIQELIKDIPEKEIQVFLEETQTSAAEENSEDIFMN